MLTVLSVAYPLAPVGPDAVGGAEQVLGMLDRGLVAAGHRSIVVACEGSGTAGAFVPVPFDACTVTDEVRRTAQAATRDAIAYVLQHWRVDLVHMHGPDFPAYLPAEPWPVLVTLHLRPPLVNPEVAQVSRPRTWLNCVSASQREALATGDRFVGDIENGVAVERLGGRVRKRRLAVALGRICAEKGFHLALDAAARADVPMLLAGRVFPYDEHQQYFAREIVPRLSRSRRFIGAAGAAKKRRLLAAAQCLLVASVLPETSSLVAMEALASGTPVVAFAGGALSNIIEHTRTGFLVRSVDEMAEAIAACSALDPDCCRESARHRFSADRMVRGYLSLYERLAACA